MLSAAVLATILLLASVLIVLVFRQSVHAAADDLSRTRALDVAAAVGALGAVFLGVALAAKVAAVALSLVSGAVGLVGVAVTAFGSHSCMSCRGVRKSGATMATSAMRGLFKTDAKARSEYLALCQIR